MSIPPLLPPGVALARLSSADLPWLTPLQADVETMRFIFGGPRDAAGTARDVASSEATWDRFGWGMWSVRADGTPVGVAGLPDRPDLGAPGIRIILGPQARGHGLGLPLLVATWDHAFLSDWPDVDHVAGTLQVANAVSRAIVEAGGMRLESAFIRGGVPTERWGIRRAGWRARRQAKAA
jgi:RimJ/RimL family protein N-acetyltransferase